MVVLPLRVIDIPATLATVGGIHLSKPTDWDFHILSHTWSAEIRKLSEKIGKLLTKPMDIVEMNVEYRAAAYNDAFENVDFKDDPESSEAHEHLRELLILMREDGVQKLWFDALCIDQTSSDEKSREISRMADYYSNSQGCYVLTFGVGQGYRLWSDIKETMPRWFQRVWTLQEFILPKKLTFLVEALDTRLIQMVKDSSCTLWNSRLGFCKCGVPSDLLEFDPPSIRKFRDMGGAMCPTSKGIVDSVDGVCPKCKRGMLVRGPCCVNGKQIHFIDREAYLFIVRAGIAIGEGSTNMKHEEMLCGLFGLLEADKVDPRLIILKIGERFCSHEEDRVLSILGLMGVNLESNEQLRTDKSLDEQIIEAAQKCPADTLVLLFATDGVGNPTMGMSWAPNFRDSWESLICGWNDNSHCRVDRDIKKKWIGGIQRFKRKMEVLRVSAGGIRVACKKVNGYVRAICKDKKLIDGSAVTAESTDDAATHDLFCSNNGERIMSMEASSWMFDSEPSKEGEADHVKCRAVDGKFQIIYLVSTNDNHSRLGLTVATEKLPRNANKQAGRALAGLDVCMVLLGCIEEDDKDLIMVCLENDKQELHKIGILVLPVHQSNLIFGNKVTQECMIGGLGRDLSKYVDLNISNGASEGLVTKGQEEHHDDDTDDVQVPGLYLVCKGLLCPPMGGPPVPSHLQPEVCKDVHDRLWIPEFQSTKHHQGLKHL